MCSARSWWRPHAGTDRRKTEWDLGRRRITRGFGADFRREPASDRGGPFDEGAPERSHVERGPGRRRMGRASSIDSDVRAGFPEPGPVRLWNRDADESNGARCSPRLEVARFRVRVGSARDFDSKDASGLPRYRGRLRPRRRGDESSHQFGRGSADQGESYRTLWGSQRCD